MNGFPRVPLGDLVIDERPKRSIAESTIWNLNLDQIEPGTGRVLERMWVQHDKLGLSTYPFESGTVLYSKLRPYLNKVVVADEAGYATTELVPLRCDGKRMLPSYLAYFLRSAEFLSFANTVVAGAKMPRMVMSEFWKYEVPLPSLTEQYRITAIFDKADSLRTKRREALAQLDRLAQAIFVEMFGDPVKHGWPVETIENVAAPIDGAMRTGPFGSQLLHSEFSDEGVAVLGIDNAVTNEFRWGERRFITEAKYRELRRYTVKPGDVLITIMGTCGRCAVVPDNIPLAINTKHLCCITLNRERCLPEFLHSYFMWHPMARQYLSQTSKGAIMDGLNMGIIKAMPLAIPPVQLQGMFKARLAEVNALKAAHRRALDETDAVFASLQHRAFRSEL